MNKDIKERWIKALRSGNYKQTKGRLRKNDCFCVLGVLADLYCKEKNIPWVMTGNPQLYVVEGHGMTLPNSIQEWAGLDGVGIDSHYDSFRMSFLVTMNDDRNATFEDIAEYLEKEFD